MPLQNLLERDFQKDNLQSVFPNVTLHFLHADCFGVLKTHKKRERPPYNVYMYIYTYTIFTPFLLSAEVYQTRINVS